MAGDFVLDEGLSAGHPSRGMDERYLPQGAYPMGPTDAGRIGDALGMLSPILKQVAEGLHLPQNLVNGFLGQHGVLSTRGSFSHQTNFANELFNQQSAQFNKDSLTGFERQVDQAKLHVATEFYNKILGDRDKAKIQAQEAISGGIPKLGGLAAGYIMDEYDFAGLRRGVISTGMLGGATVGPASKSEERQKRYSEYSKALAGEWGTSKFSFGGLTGTEVGQVSTMLARVGVIDFRTSGGASKAKESVEKVKQMSRALSPLKELFHESIPQLFSRLDDTFGVSAASMNPMELQTRVLKLKHTASLTGTSVETLMKMGKAASGLLEGIGESGMGSDVIGAISAGMIGSGVDMSRLNPTKFRKEVVKNVTGQLASRAAKDMSGAVAIWMDQNNMENTLVNRKAAVEAVSKMVGTNVSTANLARKLGVSEEDIISAGMSEKGEDIRTSTDIASKLTHSRFSDVKFDAARELAYRERMSNSQRKRKALAAVRAALSDGKIKSTKDIEKILKAHGISGKELSPMMGTVRNALNMGAKANGYTNWREAAAMDKAATEGEEIQKKAGKLAGIEKTYTNTANTSYGLLGALFSDSEDMADMWSAATGHATVNLDKKVLKDMSEADQGVLNKAVRFSITHSKTANEKQKKAIKALAAVLGNKHATADEVSEAATGVVKSSYSDKALKKLEAARKSLGMSDKAFWGAWSGESAEDPDIKHGLLEHAAMNKAIGKKGAKYSEGFLKKYKDYVTEATKSGDFDINEFLSEEGINKKDAAKFKAAFKEGAKEVGLKEVKPKFEMSTVLNDLVGVLKKLAEKMP